MRNATNEFERQMGNIPHLAQEEDDVDRYVRCLKSLLAAHEDEIIGDGVSGAMTDAVTFVAHDAFRRGFEACHENILMPLRESTVPRETALKAIGEHGIKVRNAISAAFEDEPGVPNSLTVEIDEMPLPEFNEGDLQ